MPHYLSYWMGIALKGSRYTEEHIEYVREKAKIEGITNEQITDMFNKEFDQERTINSIKYLKSKNGIILNNVKSKAHAGKNRRGSRPIGAERVRKGYVEVKVKQPNVWDQKHRHIWEQHHGKKLKHNEIVIFADKNNRNFDIDNLIMVHRKYLGQLNINNYITENPELTKVGVGIVKLNSMIYEKENSK